MLPKQHPHLSCADAVKDRSLGPQLTIPSALRSSSLFSQIMLVQELPVHRGGQQVLSGVDRRPCELL